MEMRAARYIEKKPVLAIQRDEGRVAVAPVGQSRQQRTVAIGIGGKHLKLRTDRARFRQALAFPETARPRVRIEGDQTGGVVDRIDEGERRMVRTPAAEPGEAPSPPGHAVGGQIGEMDRQDALVQGTACRR